MDVQPYQTPPRWWSPLLSPGWFRFWGWTRRRRIRVKHHRLMEIEIRGLEHLQKCLAEKQGVLIAPNHSCRAAPSILLRSFCLRSNRSALGFVRRPINVNTVNRTCIICIPQMRWLSHNRQNNKTVNLVSHYL